MGQNSIEGYWSDVSRVEIKNIDKIPPKDVTFDIQKFGSKACVYINYPSDVSNDNKFYKIGDGNWEIFKNEYLEIYDIISVEAYCVDDAGNQTQIFKVNINSISNENNVSLNSNYYNVLENGLITNVIPKTTVEQFKKNFNNLPANIMVSDSFGNLFKDDDLIGSTTKVSLLVDGLPTKQFTKDILRVQMFFQQFLHFQLYQSIGILKGLILLLIMQLNT